MNWTFETGYEGKQIINPETVIFAELKTDKDVITAYNELCKARHWQSEETRAHGVLAGEMERKLADTVRERLEKAGFHAHIFQGGSTDCNCRRDQYLHGGFGSIEVHQVPFSSKWNIDLTDEELFDENGKLRGAMHTWELLRERVGEPVYDLKQMVEDGEIEQETADIIKEILDNEGLYEVQEVDEENKNFRSGSQEFTWMDSEEDAEARARERLEDDDYLWKEAVANDNTTLDFDDWVDQVLRIDGWASTLCSYNGSYDTLENGQVYWRSS